MASQQIWPLFPDGKPAVAGYTSGVMTFDEVSKGDLRYSKQGKYSRDVANTLNRRKALAEKLKGPMPSELLRLP